MKARHFFSQMLFCLLVILQLSFVINSYPCLKCLIFHLFNFFNLVYCANQYFFFSGWLTICRVRQKQSTLTMKFNMSMAIGWELQLPERPTLTTT